MRAKATYLKYLYYLTHCGGIKKMKNYILNKIEKKTKKIYLKSLPINIMISPGNICNLSCPGCDLGAKSPDLIQPRVLSFQQFKHIFEQIKDYIFNISLFGLGEPFLNKEIFRMIDYSSKNRCGTTIHSNFNIFDAEMAEKAIESRLTHIYLSIEGVSQEIYEKYRIGADIATLFRNIEILVNMKKKKKSIFPLLTWKYLIFPYNIHEIELSRQKAKILGFDAFEVFHANLDNLGTFGIVKHYDFTSGTIKTFIADFCDSLWDSVMIYPDGSVFPCCKSFRKKDVFGNIYDEPFRKIWNNHNFLNARMLLNTRETDNPLRYPCRDCGIIKKLQRKS